MCRSCRQAHFYKTESTDAINASVLSVLKRTRPAVGPNYNLRISQVGRLSTASLLPTSNTALRLYREACNRLRKPASLIKNVGLNGPKIHEQGRNKNLFWKLVELTQQLRRLMSENYSSSSSSPASMRAMNISYTEFSSSSSSME